MTARQEAKDVIAGHEGKRSFEEVAPDPTLGNVVKHQQQPMSACDAVRTVERFGHRASRPWVWGIK